MEQKIGAQKAAHTPGRFYGRFARFARLLLRTFSRRYEAKVDAPETPAVYVCRHLNMHGPYTTLKWLPFQVHPFSLNVFFSDETAIRQYREYTFSVRRGKPVKKFSINAWITGKVTVRLLRSFQAIPVYRDSQAIRTMRAEYTAVVRPDFDGYYDRVDVLYEELRTRQATSAQRIAAGEDASVQVGEIWEFFGTIG